MFSEHVILKVPNLAVSANTSKYRFADTNHTLLKYNRLTRFTMVMVDSLKKQVMNKLVNA